MGPELFILGAFLFVAVASLSSSFSEAMSEAEAEALACERLVDEVGALPGEKLQQLPIVPVHVSGISESSTDPVVVGPIRELDTSTTEAEYIPPSDLDAFDQYLQAVPALGATKVEATATSWDEQQAAPARFSQGPNTGVDVYFSQERQTDLSMSVVVLDGLEAHAIEHFDDYLEGEQFPLPLAFEESDALLDM